jgi:hypothetical protein
MINEYKMSLYNVLDKAYFHLIDFLTDKELYYLSVTNRTTTNIMKQGFAHTISYSNKDNHNIFIKRFNNHYRFINHIIFRNVIDPIIWAPIITPKITLQNCAFTYPIESLPKSTELILENTIF